MNDPLGIVGQILEGKYQVEKAVGEGGFATVYRAEHLVWKRPVALKCFHGLAQAHPELREALMRDFVAEGALLTELSSQTASIVQARDIGNFTSPDGRWIPYMVLEWLDGASLETLLEREAREGAKRWSLDATLQVLRPACTALQIAHGRGIAHRDIKPANLFVVEGSPHAGPCTVKILDFGIAKVITDRQELTAASAKTGQGINSFTPQYGAPEQFSRTFGATGPWTDVYALALLAVELLTGSHALDGDDVAQLAFASTAGPRPTPAARGRDLGTPIESVFEKALAVDPKARHKNAGEFLRGLEAAMSGSFSPRTSEDVAATATGYSPVTQATVVAPASPSLSQSSPRDNAARALRSHGIRNATVLGLLVLAAAAGGLLWAKGSGSSAKPLPTQASAVPLPAASASAQPVLSCPDDMVLVPKGQLFIGSDAKDAQANERPVHHARLSAFCFDKTEVTVAAYKACSDDGRCLPAGKEVRWPGSEKLAPSDLVAYSTECNITRASDRQNHPVNCVDHAMALRFCESVNKRLPTESEWEYATRGPDGRTYPWGDETPAPMHLNSCGSECLAWHREHRIQKFAPEVPLFAASDGYATTAPVGSFPAGSSRFGAHDVVGNVWEWVADWYAPYEPQDQESPTGPASGTERVIRGGAFNGSFATWLRPSFRFKFEPGARSWAIGFRCAKSL